MADGGLLERIIQLYGPFVGAWATFCLVAVHYLRARNERRRDAVAEKASAWSQMESLLQSVVAEVQRLGARLQTVEAENEECRKNLKAVRDELATETAARVRMEAFLEGIGQAEQHAQLIVSAERAIDAKKRDNPDA